MGSFEFEETELKGTYLITPFYSGDNRGDFTKLFETRVYKKAGIDFILSESFVSTSCKNVIRGMHFQISNPQAKIVSVISGSIFDVIVDLRPNSKTFGEWRGFELNSENHKALYIARGFAHGFLSLEDNTSILYQCDGLYDSKTDTGIRFDDADINIQWPVENINSCIHSQRDLTLMSFEEYKMCPMILGEN